MLNKKIPVFILGIVIGAGSSMPVPNDNLANALPDTKGSSAPINLATISRAGEETAPSTFRDCPNLRPEIVVISASTFIMGGLPSEQFRRNHES